MRHAVVVVVVGIHPSFKRIQVLGIIGLDRGGTEQRQQKEETHTGLVCAIVPRRNAAQKIWIPGTPIPRKK
jgi:hypothetical protein